MFKYPSSQKPLLLWYKWAWLQHIWNHTLMSSIWCWLHKHVGCKRCILERLHQDFKGKPGKTCNVHNENSGRIWEHECKSTVILRHWRGQECGTTVERQGAETLRERHGVYYWKHCRDWAVMPLEVQGSPQLSQCAGHRITGFHEGPFHFWSIQLLCTFVFLPFGMRNFKMCDCIGNTEIYFLFFFFNFREAQDKCWPGISEDTLDFGFDEQWYLLTHRDGLNPFYSNEIVRSSLAVWNVMHYLDKKCSPTTPCVWKLNRAWRQCTSQWINGAPWWICRWMSYEQVA